MMKQLLSMVRMFFESGFDENETVPLNDYESHQEPRSGGIPIQVLEEVILTDSEEVVR